MVAQWACQDVDISWRRPRPADLDVAFQQAYPGRIDIKPIGFALLNYFSIASHYLNPGFLSGDSHRVDNGLQGFNFQAFFKDKARG